MQYNKNIFKYLFSFILVVMSMGFAFAHNPSNSTTLLIEGKKEGTWMLQIRASLTAFEQEVHTRYTKDSYKTPEEFKELVLQLFSEDLNISINNLPVTVANGQVKLGHETVVVYQFKGIEPFDVLTIKNKAFKNVHNSKNVLFVLKNGIDKNKFTLNKKNNFQVDLKIENNKLVEITEINKAEIGSNSLMLLIIIALLALGGFLFYKKNTNQITTKQ